MVDAVVKIDGDILKEVENFIKDNKYHYSSKKQLVTLAIVEFLKSHSLNIKSKKRAK